MTEIATISTHREYLEEIFKIKGKLNTIIEFGMGDFSSGLLVENGKNVVSIEMQNKSWYDKISNKFSKMDNWEGILSLGPHTYKTLELPKKVDLAFVDGHGSSRFDCINDMMDIGCKTIVAHDTQQPTYYWDRVKVNEEYKKLTFKKHSVWTSMWTKDTELYEKIKNKK